MPREYEINLPTLFPGQVEAYNVFANNRFMALRCGRRWGKTDFDTVIGCDAAAKGHPVGWFAPDYKIQAEAYNGIADYLEPIKKSSSKVEGVIRTITGGRIDFWTLENDRAGRSRKYKLVIVDEAAFTKENMMDIWEKNIKPTLLDLGGKALVSSNTNGIADDNFFYRICPKTQEGEKISKYGFTEYHAPTHTNPYLPAEEVAKLQAENHPLVYSQEYLAEFVDWSGVAFFGKDKWLVNGAGVPEPTICDMVYAVIDSGTKTGQENDGTAVTYFARGVRAGDTYVGHPLIVLDWDIQQIEGALLETWLPTVFARLEELALRCRARMGNVGVFIEDKDSGQILIQQAQRREWKAHPIDSKLTSAGKDGRAISISGYHYRGHVKMTQYALDKVTVYKGTARNHLLSQVIGFRVGDKDAKKRADDLLDTYCYGVAIGLGNNEGY